MSASSADKRTKFSLYIDELRTNILLTNNLDLRGPHKNYIFKLFTTGLFVYYIIFIQIPTLFDETL